MVTYFKRESMERANRCKEKRGTISQDKQVHLASKNVNDIPDMQVLSEFSEAEEYFNQVVSIAQNKGKNYHVKLLLTWLLGEYFLFEYGVGVLSNGSLKGQYQKFFAGYHSLLKTNRWKLRFEKNEWKMMVGMINSRYNLSSLQSGLKTRLRIFRKDPVLYMSGKEDHYLFFEHHRMVTKTFQRKSDEFVAQYKKCYWIDKGMDIPPSEKSIIWKIVPSNFYVMHPSSSVEIWKDGEQIIGGRFKGAVPEKDRPMIRTWIKYAWEDQWSVCRADSRSALKNTMRAVGPLVNWREGKGNHYVSFYRNKLKIAETTSMSSLQLQILHEQCSHRILLEIILVLFCEKFWPVVSDFLGIGFPFMDLSDELLRCFSHPNLMKHSVLAYPLFITKDYCNVLHSDNDASMFTMFMSSNPGMEDKGGELIIPEYGIRIPPLDGDLYFIRGQDLHGTSYKEPCKESTYVVGVAINEKLGEAYKFVNEDV